jgi:hypothetical protein
VGARLQIAQEQKFLLKTLDFVCFINKLTCTMSSERVSRSSRSGVFAGGQFSSSAGSPVVQPIF